MARSALTTLWDLERVNRPGIPGIRRLWSVVKTIVDVGFDLGFAVSSPIGRFIPFDSSFTLRI
jgi:hypothetical protein